MQSTPPGLYEVRIYGLSVNVTTAMLSEFLGKSARTRGIFLQPQTKGTFQWAQVYVATEAEVESLLSLREVLAVSGITISRVGGGSAMTPPRTTWDVFTELSKRGPSSRTYEHVPALNNPFNAPDTASSLPRNLYVLNLPLDLTQEDFKELFTPWGVVTHSILLSQLDSSGRRRGFVLMSEFREAMKVLHEMHGKWIDGFKLDVSWALVQREAKNTHGNGNSLPNRVVHPPAVSARREAAPGCSVLVENLNANLFPDTDSIMAIFRIFGPIARAFKLTSSSAVIQFDNGVSAAALAKANGHNLGTHVLKTRILDDGPSGATFDPFADAPRNANSQTHPLALFHDAIAQHDHGQSWRSTRLNADSEPFVPGHKSPPIVSDFLSSHKGVLSRPPSTRSNSDNSLKPPVSPNSSLSRTSSVVSVTFQDTA